VSKSHVSIEQKVCCVCGVPYDCGILLDKRLRDRLDKYTITGQGMCEDHKHIYDQDFIALVELSGEYGGNTVKQEHANRTGRIAFMHVNKASEIFDASFHDKDGKLIPLMFVDDGVFDKIGITADKFEGSES